MAPDRIDAKLVLASFFTDWCQGQKSTENKSDFLSLLLRNF
jgi:hypothetical protein